MGSKLYRRFRDGKQEIKHVFLGGYFENSSKCIRSSQIIGYTEMKGQSRIFIFPPFAKSGPLLQKWMHMNYPQVTRYTKRKKEHSRICFVCLPLLDLDHCCRNEFEYQPCDALFNRYYSWRKYITYWAIHFYCFKKRVKRCQVSSRYTLRKHAYSNILKILQPKKMKIFR